MNHFPTHCARCGADLATVGSIMSKFNQDTICMGCKARELAHPDYKAADAAEIAAVRAGNYNFPGIGAPAVLFRPACIAEQVAMRIRGKPSDEATVIALDHGGQAVDDPDANSARYRFTDCSEISIVLISPVGCTVTLYPQA